MRILIIFGALILGIAGLFISLCGGGFLFTVAHGANSEIAVIAALAFGLGLLCLWGSVKTIRKQLERSRDDRH